jgi:hypothetical protein
MILRLWVGNHLEKEAKHFFKKKGRAIDTLIYMVL